MLLCCSSFFCIAVQVNGKDLRHSADSLGGAGAEQQPGTRADKFRMLQEAEDDRGRVVGADVIGAHETLHDGRLLDAADMHCRLETSVDERRMKQDDYTGLWWGEPRHINK